MQRESSSSVRIFYPRISREDLIEQLKAKLPDLTKELPLFLAVLFGSYAKGNYTVASDVDILVVHKGEERTDAFAKVKKALDIPLLQPHVYSEREYEALKETLGRMTAGGVVLMDATKEGAAIEKLLTKAREDAAVLAVLLFGSAVRREQTPLSDIDICLVLAPQPTPFEPAELSRKRLDYLKDFPLDVQIFQQLPLYIRTRVLREGQILFVREETLLYELAFRTIQAFEDFKHIYYSYLEEVAIAGS